MKLTTLLCNFFLLFIIPFSLSAQFTISNSGPADGCTSPVTLFVDNPVPNTTYNWFVGSYACTGGSSQPAPYGFPGSMLQVFGTGEFYCIGTDMSGGIQISNPVTVRILPGSIGSMLLPRPYNNSPVNCLANVPLCVPTVFYQNFPSTVIAWYVNNSVINGASQPSYNASVSGWYKYSITSSCITAFSDSVQVNIPPGTPVIFGSQPTPACAGNIVHFSMLNAQNGVSYVWEVSIDGGVYTAVGTDTSLSYTIPAASGFLVRARITSSGCNQVSNVISIQVQNIILTSSPGTPVLLCDGASAVISATTSYVPPPTFQWYRNGIAVPGATFQSLTVTLGGTYQMAATAGCGVVWSANQIVAAGGVPQAIVTANGPTEFCAGGDVLLSASSEPGYTYQWKKYGNIIGGATGSTYLAKRTGKYKAIITDSVGCIRATNAVVVTAYPYPTAQIIALGTTNICQGDSVVMTVNTDPVNTYHWKRYSTLIPGATDPLFTATAEGKYKCIVTNQYGCAKGSNAINVNIVCRESMLQETTVSEINVYPNPNNGEFYISNSGDRNNSSFSLVDNLGRVVHYGELTPGEATYTVSGLSSGMYMLVLKSNQGTKTHRIVVNK